MTITEQDTFIAKIRPWGESQVRPVRLWVDQITYRDDTVRIAVSDTKYDTHATVVFPADTDVTVAMLRNELAN